jgi:hypothetical protein
VETLRGLTGSDFEGPARVTRGNTSGLCSCFGNNNGEPNKKGYVLIKGANLFVFAKEDSAAPKYAVELTHKKISLHEALGHTQVVTLESGLGDVEYKFKFDLRENPELAKNFAVAMREQVAVGESNEVKQKLGHRPAFDASKSVKYANTVAAKKKEDQLDAPIGMAEVMANGPSIGAY